MQRRSYLLLFACLLGIGLVTKADQQKLDSLYEALDLNSGQKEITNTHIAFSKAYLNENLDSSIYFANKALDVALENSWEREIADSRYRLGIAIRKKYNSEKAGTYLKQSLAYYQKIKDTLKVARTQISLSYLYRDLEKYDESIRYAVSASENYSKAGYKKGVAKSYTAIGLVMNYKSDYERSRKYYKKAIQIQTELRNERGQAVNRFNIGGTYITEKKWEESLNYIRPAFQYFKRLKMKSEIGGALNALGLVYRELGRFDSSEYYILESKRVYEDLGEKKKVAEAEYNLGQLLYTRKEYVKAINLLQKFIESAEVNKSDFQLYRGHKLLSKCYEALEDYQNALYTYQWYRYHKELLLKKRNKKQIAEMEVRFHSTEQQEEMDRLKSETAKDKLILKRKKNQQYLMYGIIFLVLMIGFLLLKQYRIKKRNNELLQAKNEDLKQALDNKKVLLKEIHHRTKNNLQFISSLLNLQSRHVYDEQTLSTLNDGKNRVKSMALIHQKLYQEDNLTGVNIQDYVSLLMESLKNSYQPKDKTIETVVEIDNIDLDIDTAVPVGLILNELITNAMKYAFVDSDAGIIKVCFLKRGELLELSVEDNGIGMPSLDLNQLKTFGLNLVQSLSRKLKAVIDIETNQGTKVSLFIKNYNLSMP